MPHFPLSSPHQVVCGFVPSVLSRLEWQELEQARLAKKSIQKTEADKNNIYERLEAKGEAKRKVERRTKNRKYITHSDTIEHSGIEYLINSTKSGIYTSIVHRFIEQLDIGLQRWRRVLAVRFDLHHKDIQTHSNKWLSRFIKNLKRRLERAYGLSDLGFIWVREQERGKAQHYHLVIWLDGNIVRSAENLLPIINETWQAINPINTIGYAGRSEIFIDTEDKKREFIYWISYFAKARGKGYRAEQVKDYQCSRLTI